MKKWESPPPATTTLLLETAANVQAGDLIPHGAANGGGWEWCHVDAVECVDGLVTLATPMGQQSHRADALLHVIRAKETGRA